MFKKFSVALFGVTSAITLKSTTSTQEDVTYDLTYANEMFFNIFDMNGDGNLEIYEYITTMNSLFFSAKRQAEIMHKGDMEAIQTLYRVNETWYHELNSLMGHLWEDFVFIKDYANFASRM